MNQYNPNGFQQGPYYPDYDYLMQEKKKQKRAIRDIGIWTGGAFLLFLCFQNIISILLVLFNAYDKYLNNAVFQSSVEIISSVTCILLPFYLLGKVMQKRHGTPDIIPLTRSRDKTLSLLAIPAGMGICMAANIITSYIIIFMSFFGMELSAPELARPQGVFGFLLSVAEVAVTAAFVEEISLRGCVMQNLRKYGDSFAVVMSALAFGIMHMNLVQAPFAIIVGLGLGYITVKTDSLWPAIIIHALNNLLSTVVSYMYDMGGNETTINLIYSLMVYVFIGVGIVCFVMFVRRASYISPAVRPQTNLTAGEKTGAFFSSPTLIISIIIMIYYTSRNVSLK